MRNIAWPALLCAALSACSWGLQEITATPDEVTFAVTQYQRGIAGERAKAHCAAFGKDASLASYQDGIMAFRCVPTGG